MTTTRGFFSIIQFCPDLDRAECANVGVVLAIPKLGYVDVKLSDDNEGPKQRFGRLSYDDGRLTLAKKALEGRIRHESQDWREPDDLLKFGRKEGNHLILAAPRVILVEDPKAELEELYLKLAHFGAKHRRPKHGSPDLRAVFERQLSGVPLRRNLQVDLRELGTLDIPYGYRNGKLNLIRPEGFPSNETSATAKANDLAVKGHIIAKTLDSSGIGQRLIVVGGFDPDSSAAIRRRIEFVLDESDARLVPEDELDDFVEEVRREAHT